MQTMSQYPGAGGAFQADRNQAAAGMRSYRNDIWQKLFDLRQKGMKAKTQGNARDRRMQMLSAGLGAGGMITNQALRPQQPQQIPQSPIFNTPIDSVPMQQMLPSYLPPEMRPQRFRDGLA